MLAIDGFVSACEESRGNVAPRDGPCELTSLFLPKFAAAVDACRFGSFSTSASSKSLWCMVLDHQLLLAASLSVLRYFSVVYR